jgi:acetyl esterase/lipase
MIPFSILAGVLAVATSLGLPSDTGAAAYPKTTYVYKRVAHHPLKADVYGPHDARRHPVIFWLHGGALIFGDRTHIRAVQVERYVKAGFVVVSIDYRLAPETKLPEILEDVRDAYLWVRAKGPALFHADRDRIAVVGHSAGGYLTLAAGYHLQPRPKALVSFYGYGDITGAWYSRPDPFYLREPAVSKERAELAVGSTVISEGDEERRWPFYLYCRQQGLWPKEVAGWDPDSQPHAFDPYCPVRNVSADYPPTLLLHGDQDTDVPFEQSAMMARELARRNVEHKFIQILGGPHGFDANLNDPQAVQAFEEVLSFLKKHLQ